MVRTIRAVPKIIMKKQKNRATRRAMKAKGKEKQKAALFFILWVVFAVLFSSQVVLWARTSKPLALIGSLILLGGYAMYPSLKRYYDDGLDGDIVKIIAIGVRLAYGVLGISVLVGSILDLFFYIF